MRLKNLAFFLCVVSGVFGPAVASAGTPAAEGSMETVDQAVEGFYSALNQMFVGEIGPMEKVWSHRDDVTYTGPTGGIHIGWKNILPIWQEQSKLKLGGKVEAKDVHVVSGTDIAVVSNHEMGENTVDGQVQKVELRVTNIFRKEDGQWKMIGHHTDLLPWLVKK